ncbi:MAG: Trm112 family protein [Pseudomonas sp.]
MRVTLTDWLTCPSCGPAEGLVVLAERLESRQVIEGALGCPACQRQYPIRSGMADLRIQSSGEAAGFEPACGSDADPVRLGALLGITEGRGLVVLLGGAATHAGALAGMMPGLEIIAVGAHAASEAGAESVSRISADAVLPLRDGSVRGVVLDADMPNRLQREAVRVLAIGGRLVISRAAADAEEIARVNALREDARDANHIVVTRVH